MREITLISHSMLFYWWPIWFLGLIMAAVTYADNSRLAIVPPDTRVVPDAANSNAETNAFQVLEKANKKEDADASKRLPPSSLENAAKTTATPGAGDAFKTRVSHRVWMGPLFCVVLFLTIVITNVPLRGVWSFVVLLLLLVIALLISIVPNGWDNLLAAIGNLHIYINMAGYLFISLSVLIVWLVSMFVFDQRTYMRVTPGHIAVCEHIGASVRDINGDRVELEKKRDDMFRHWLLGFFSGDLVIRLTDTKEEIRLPNVLWLGWEIDKVRDLIRQKTTVERGT